MIFEAPQSEPFRFKFNSLGSKTLNIPEFNPVIKNRSKLTNENAAYPSAIFELTCAIIFKDRSLV